MNPSATALRGLAAGAPRTPRAPAGSPGQPARVLQAGRTPAQRSLFAAPPLALR